MNQSDRLFRWAFNLFIFLMCANLGMVIALKSIYFQAEKRMAKNGAQVDFTCGDYDNSSSFWQLPKSARLMDEKCEGDICPHSLWVPNHQQEEALYVVAVNKPRPSQVIDGELVPGHFVDVDLQITNQPTTLVLVSQQMLQWNLNLIEPSGNVATQTPVEGLDFFTSLLVPPETFISGPMDLSKDRLKEVIVIGPDLVWLEGVPEGTKVTYFNSEQICAYPTAWEEIKNPSNEFRRLYKALYAYTGLNVTHFQGKKVGRHLRVPYDGPQKENQIDKQRSISSTDAPQRLGEGLVWQREGKTLVATDLNVRSGGEVTRFQLPPSTTDALYDKGSKKLFVIRHFQFGTWDVEKKKFEALQAPLEMLAMYWPTSMTFNPLRSEIYIYNDDRGGEVFVFNVVTKKWRRLPARFGYSFISLYFDSEKESLFGTRFQGQKIKEIVEFDANGKIKDVKTLQVPLDFVKTDWHAHFVPSSNELWLKVVHPAHPEGDLHAVGELSRKM